MDKYIPQFSIFMHKVEQQPLETNTTASGTFTIQQSQRNTLRKEGLPVNENFERKANEIEEEIIKKCHNIEKAMLYIHRTIEGNWSRVILEDNLASNKILIADICVARNCTNSLGFS